MQSNLVWSQSARGILVITTIERGMGFRSFFGDNRCRVISSDIVIVSCPFNGTCLLNKERSVKAGTFLKQERLLAHVQSYRNKSISSFNIMSVSNTDETEFGMCQMDNNRVYVPDVCS